MDLKHFGDSYDIVKQSLLRWLQVFGEWSVHPMFTETVSQADCDAFERFLEAKVTCSEVLQRSTNRLAYFACAERSGHLFLDPTTGLCLNRPRKNIANYVLRDDLLVLTRERPSSLTAIFDQSLAHGKDDSRRQALEQKLLCLAEAGLPGFAYLSHACIIFTAKDSDLLHRARRHLITESKVPEWRFLPIASVPKASRAFGGTTSYKIISL